ncbi:uncharacterized protein UDID_19106 [Ustilago sp. UG-2017a]|nr:uncharacterized protein UDID_19106 [Ustilago sp. UG-2017a]
MCRQRHCSCSLSPESTFFIEYCTGGPSSTTPVLLSCVGSSDTAPPPCYPACLAPLREVDTAPPPQDLLAGLLYTAPPPSTARSSLWRCLDLLAYGPVLHVHGGFTLHGGCTPTMPATGTSCHGPECSGSRRAPVESMAVVQSPWRPWTPTDSHAKEERAHMRGGPTTKRTKLKEQAQPRRGQSSRSRHSHEEDQAQGACRWLPLRGSRDKSQRNHHRSKEEEQCIGDRQVGPEEEERCRLLSGVPSKQGSKEEEQCRRSRHSSGGQEWC